MENFSSKYRHSVALLTVNNSFVTFWLGTLSPKLWRQFVGRGPYGAVWRKAINYRVGDSYITDPDKNVKAKELREVVNTNVDIGDRGVVMESLVVTPLWSRNTLGLEIVT